MHPYPAFMMLVATVVIATFVKTRRPLPNFASGSSKFLPREPTRESPNPAASKNKSVYFT